QNLKLYTNSGVLNLVLSKFR
ncbi:phosphotransferase enzyme family protein, partial [Vibrio parahaemolyticus V-223/04]